VSQIEVLRVRHAASSLAGLVRQFAPRVDGIILAACTRIVNNLVDELAGRAECAHRFDAGTAVPLRSPSVPQERKTSVPDKPDTRARLRDAILRGAYGPRQRLIEAELAEEYGASRFALRNALIALAAEGLVELQPNRGARVREISVTEAIEITEIRRSVESLVAARAAENARAAEIAFLQQLGQDMREAVGDGELMRYSELNLLLHRTVREIAAHATAARVLEQLNGQMVRHQFQLALVPGRLTVSLPEHLAIIDAVCAGDPEAARAAMTTHVDSVIHTLESKSLGGGAAPGRS